MSGFYQSVHGVQGLCEGLPHAGGLALTSHTGSRRGRLVLPRGWMGFQKGVVAAAARGLPAVVALGLQGAQTFPG